jgi:MFS family permease
MGLAPNVLWLMAAGALTGMGNGVVNVTSGTLITAAAKPAERGRVAAVMNGATSGCLVAAYVVGGAVASVLSPREVFLAGGCLAMLAPVAIGRLVVRAATGSAQADFSRRSRLGGSRRTRVG